VPREIRVCRAPSNIRCGAGGRLGLYSGSGMFRDEHITMAITVGLSRLKHSGGRAMHVKQVL
jgi:hypothetical protein